MIAALAAHDPGEKQYNQDQGRQQCADHQHAIGLDLLWRRFQSQGTGELRAMEERDERYGDDQPDQRDRSQRQGEFGVGDMRKLPIMMFCGLPVIVAVDPTFDATATASR